MPLNCPGCGRPHLERAILVRRTTPNGVFGLQDHVPFGRVYVVDLERMETVTAVDLRTGVPVPNQFVIYACEEVAMDLDEEWGWMPTGLLAIGERL